MNFKIAGELPLSSHRSILNPLHSTLIIRPLTFDFRHSTFDTFTPSPEVFHPNNQPFKLTKNENLLLSVIFVSNSSPMKILKIVASGLLFFSILFAPSDILSIKALKNNLIESFDEANAVYTDLDLASLGLDYSVFQTAFSGYQKMVVEEKVSAPGIFTIADLSQPSVNKRLYIIDLRNRKVLFNTWVSHGKNTGDLLAQKFSNIPGSLQSSLGFYVTGNTYNGKHGLSLQLNGMEPGINDKALERAIVIHGADYVSSDFIRNTGRLGRSFGCPAIASELAEPIIHTIQNGTGLFVYYPDNRYLKNSKLLANR